MGTETDKADVEHISYWFKVVKLNNPLMGTETAIMASKRSARSSASC